MTSSKPDYLSEAPSPNISTLGVGASIYELGGGHNSVHKILSKINFFKKS